jgi:hypothetical protein
MSKNPIFIKNPNLKEYFQTSDGNKFYSLNHAQAHCKLSKLSLDEIEHFTRNAEKEVKQEPISQKQEIITTANDVASKAKIVSIAKDKPLNKMNKKELEKIALGLNISIEGLTNGQAVEAIKQAQKPAVDESKTSEASTTTSEGDTSTEGGEASEVATSTSETNNTNANNE